MGQLSAMSSADPALELRSIDVDPDDVDPALGVWSIDVDTVLGEGSTNSLPF